jgi:hypothetical protein
MVGRSVNSFIHVFLSLCLVVHNAVKIELDGWEIAVDLIFFGSIPLAVLINVGIRQISLQRRLRRCYHCGNLTTLSTAHL